MTRAAGATLLAAAEAIELGTTELPLLGRSNIWVEDSLAGSASIRLAQTVILQALARTAPGQLEVIVYDDALSGLAAPFAPLNSGGEKILLVLHDEQDFKSTLRYLRDHVQAVKNLMRGETPSLVEFRAQIAYPVEGYKLVVVSTDYSFLDDASQTQLGILLKAGPAAGVSFLIHSMTLGANQFAVALCDHLTVKPPGVIERAGEDIIRGWLPSAPKQLAATSEEIARGIASTAMAPIAFTEVQNLARQWSDTSENGVTFAVGKYGDETVEITLGDELNQRHNMLVTGAVGQGKSNLISVAIHSICQRYSPREVELYLLDFKEGVTLQPFFDEATGSYLPHARVLGLDADREFGYNVLKKLHEIYRERMALFKSSGVQNICQYRLRHTEREMPRIMVIIDEFQTLFDENDSASDEIAAVLVRSVRLFRACGIHLILASQTIGGNMALMGAIGESLFAQIPVRVALKNSLSESRATLGDRNEAAAHLRAREAIVNHDYGDLSANKKTTIAYADERVLLPLRNVWWRDASMLTTPPHVFMGERRYSLTAAVDQLRTRPSTGKASLLLGSRIEVNAQPLAVPFGRDIGRNVVLLGTGGAVEVLQNLALSVAAQTAGARFVILDFLDGQPSWNATRQSLERMLSRLGACVEVVDAQDGPAILADLARRMSSRRGEPDLILLGLGMDRCRAMPPEFQELVKVGPTVGIHVIGWWQKLGSFREHVGYGGESFFDIRLALRLDRQSAKDLMADPLLEWRAVDNRMLVWDAAELAEPVRVIPYTIVDDGIIEALGKA